MNSRGLMKWNPPDIPTQHSPAPDPIRRASVHLVELTPVQRLLRLVHKHLWTIGTCIAVALSVSFLYAMRQPRLYRATANIAIDRDSNAGVSLSKFVSGMGDADDYSVSLETQVRVLSSRSLAASVVRKLDLTHHREFMRDANRQFGSFRGDAATDSESITVEAFLSGLSV